MKEMISLQHEGVCSVCKKKILVVLIGDVDTKKVASICKKCSIELGKKGKKFDDFINEYGNIDEEPFKNNSINIYSNKKEGC